MLWRYAQHMLHSYGELVLQRGDIRRALDYADECLALAEATDSRKNVIKAKRLRAQVRLAEAKPDEAEHDARDAVEIARQIANPGQLWKSWDTLGDVYDALGQGTEAIAAWNEAVAVIDRVAESLSDEALRRTFLGSRHVTEIRAKLG